MCRLKSILDQNKLFCTALLWEAHPSTFVDIRTGKHESFLLAHPETAELIETRGSLTFYVHEGRRTLTEVGIAGSSMHGRLVVQPSVDKELAKQTPPESSSIEIAMN